MTVDELLALLEQCAGFYDSLGDDGDPIPILDHGLQCATLLARKRPDDLELHVAGLIHDVGHRIAPGESEAHGVIAADAVRSLLGERVAALVELHVPAKRYLVTTDDSYLAGLSTGSTASLLRQGSLMSDSERHAFENGAFFQDALELRRSDEAAKVVGAVVDGIDRWRPVIERVASMR
jgi:predicted HD phosphohydrolase